MTLWTIEMRCLMILPRYIMKEQVFRYRHYRRLIMMDFADRGDAKYLNAITCKRKYLSLIEELIGLYGKERLTRKDMEAGLIEWERNRYDLEQVKFDYFRSDDTEILQECAFS